MLSKALAGLHFFRCDNSRVTRTSASCATGLAGEYRRRGSPVRSPVAAQADRSLAIQGGIPRLRAVPHEDTGIDPSAADDVAAVVRTGRTCYWGGGPKAKEFERAFAALVGRRAGFFHNSGTAALQTALFALNVGSGDEVALGSSGFCAAANVVHHLQARPVFLPTNPDTLLVDENLAPWLGGDTKAALITHFFGNVVDVEEVQRALPPGVPLVEDAGQAHGALLRGRRVGSFGEIGSFAGSHKKLVAAGQGGINVYDSDDIDYRMRMYAHHGKDGSGEVRVAGYNLRGGEMEATLALASLRRLEQLAHERNAAASAMRAVCEEAGVRCAQPSGTDCLPVWFDLPVILDEDWREHRAWLLKALEAENVAPWTYPSLIQLEWVRAYLTERGWWGDREEAVLAHEAKLWDRVVVLPTQVSRADAVEQAEALVAVIAA